MWQVHTALFFWDEGGPERIGSPGSPKRRWDDNIKMNQRNRMGEHGQDWPS